MLAGSLAVAEATGVSLEGRARDLSAKPLSLRLEMDGGVSVGAAGARLAPVIHREGWKGSAIVQRSDFTFPDAVTGTATVDLVAGKETLGAGRVTLQATANGRAAVDATVTSRRDQRPEAVPLSLTLPCEAYAEASWKTSSGKTGVLEKTWDAKRSRGFSDRVTWVEFAPVEGETIRLSFTNLTAVSFQDNRAWKAPTFTLRIHATGGRIFNANDSRSFHVELSSLNGVTTDIAKPIVITAGEEWIPLDYRKDIEAGSALDFSNQGLQDAPAGKYGWLRNVNGHFEFENRPGVKQRFYGVNLCFSANFPDHDFADRLVTRLVRLGYNTVRIHHYESADGVVKGAADGLTLNAERMDKLDYLLAKCIEKGLYVTTDLFTSRPVMWRAIGVDREGRIDQQVYKNLVPVHEGAYRNWAAFTRNLLTHVNPYTGRAYKDEPGLPLLSLINEGTMTWRWDEMRSEPCMKAAWTTWLAGKRRSDSAFGKELDDPEKVSRDSAACRLFMADTERALVTRQRAFLKELGVKALLTNQNCGGNSSLPMFAVREDLYDYVDDHFYVDHPHFLVRKWSLPSRCGNRNPAQASAPPPAGTSFSRLPTKPFCITEWNFSGPGMFRGVGGIMTGAMGALQDWDGLWRFAYSHKLEGMQDRRGFPGFFDVASDPLGQAGDRASLCLFLRGDLDPLPDIVVNQVTPDLLSPTSRNVKRAVPSWARAAWQIRTGTTVSEVPGVPTFPFAEQASKEQAPVPLKPNPAIAIDSERGSFRIVTPKTSGGFVPSGVLEAGAISFDVGDVAATVWASALDGKALSESRRILLTHLTDVQAKGNVYADKEKRTLLKWGSYPPLVRNGEAHISLALTHPEDYTVWALETTGRRLEKIPSTVRDGKLQFTAAVKGPNGARMLYEIVAEPSRCARPLRPSEVF